MLFPKREWWSHIERIKDVERGHHLFTVGLQFLILFLSTSPITNLQFCRYPIIPLLNLTPFSLKLFRLGSVTCNQKESRIQKHHFALIMKFKDLCLTSWHPLVLPSFPTSSFSSLFFTFCCRTDDLCLPNSQIGVFPQISIWPLYLV